MLSLILVGFSGGLFCKGNGEIVLLQDLSQNYL